MGKDATVATAALNLGSLDAGSTGGAWRDDLFAPYSEREAQE